MKSFTFMLLGASFATLAAGCGSEVETGSKSGAAGDAGNGGTAGAAMTGGTDNAGGNAGAAGVAGAGGNVAGSAGSAGDNGMPSDVYPAPHPDPPRVISLGGPVLLSPKIYPVYFANDDPAFTGKITDFTNKVGATDYWLATVEEYGGVGPASSAPPIQLGENAPANLTDDQIQNWLEGKLNSNDPAFPTADDNTLIALFYPASVTITLQGAKSCEYFGAYHNNITLDGAHGNRNVAYAVMPHCKGFGGMSELDAMTSSASHEFIEAATDPYPFSDPAHAQVDNEHIFWQLALGGGENADLCAQSASSFVKFPELPQYMVQRSWSNISAMAGHDPCVPTLPGNVYFNSAPVMPDKITVNIGQIVKMEGVVIPVGEERTIEVALFSDAKTSGPWSVKAFDLAALQGGSPELDLAFDKDSGVNGEKLNLTIKVLKQSQYGINLFYLLSNLGNQQNIWIGLVGN